MILKASQRRGTGELAKHLLNGDENDHITVHEIRGFVSDDLAGALQEIEAISRGTQCRQFMFSLSLSPPEYADVPVEDFESAIDDVEKKLGLVDQPRIIVFHEKNGRRHCHCVWSRLKWSDHAQRMIAIRMSHFKLKLMEISRFLFLKYGWKLPKGMQRASDRSPWQLTRHEYRQAVRFSQDPQALKTLLKSAWEQSDSKETFAHALQERGFLLARGDRRGFVALDIIGGVYSLTRWLDIGTRDLKARLGKPENLPAIGQAKDFLAARMSENLKTYLAESRARAKDIRKPLVREIRAMVAVQRKERQELIDRQQERWTRETHARVARLPRGFRGIWHKASGAYKKVRAQNEAETRSALERDRQELHNLVRSHLLERQELQKTVKVYKEEQKAEALRIRREIAGYVATATEPQTVKSADVISLKEQMAEVQSKIALLSGNLAMLQSALESNLISDDMGAAIRRMIEVTLETLHLKKTEEKTRETRAQDREREYVERQAQFNEYIRQYAELQVRQEEEARKRAANRQFYDVVMNMSYALNGIPRWEVSVMPPPPEQRLDERAYSASLRQQSNSELLKTVFTPRPRPPVDPSMATVNLRSSVLETKEILRRAGLQPDGGKSAFDPKQKVKVTTPPPKASAWFNARR